MPKKSPWAIGCGIVLLFLLLLLLAGGLLTFRGWTWFRGQMTRAEEWRQFEKDWNAARLSEDPDVLFPRSMGEFARSGYATNVSLPALNISRPGHHATYVAGPRTVQLAFYPASEEEQRTGFADAKKALQAGRKPGQPSHYHVETTVGNRFSFKTGPPEERGVGWWDGERLFWVLTGGGDDPEAILQDYLEDLKSRLQAAELEAPVK